jgi:uncharacterized membrane protein YfcA
LQSSANFLSKNLFDITVAELVVVGAVGIVAGIINGTVGGGSLLTYPLLVSVGISPVWAAATNSTGLATGNMAALIPHRHQQTVPFRDWKWHAVATASGSIIGGLLLITLPEKIFEFLVPILLVGASLTMVVKPKQTVATHKHPKETKALLVLSGVYNGYFGPGQGVLAIAILLRDGRLSVQQTVVIKNLVLALSNVVVATLFILTGHVVWPIALTLLATAATGGWIGGKVAGAINPTFTRWFVAATGFISAAWFILR